MSIYRLGRQVINDIVLTGITCNSKDLSLPHSSRDERKKAATNWDEATPEREKVHAFSVGSGRGKYWQRPLPIMAAGGKKNGSGRCLPC